MIPTVYAPEFVINGVARIVGKDTNMWASSPTAGLPQWLELRWDKPVRCNTVMLTFDTDLNLPFHTEPLPPECVRDYRIERWSDGGWKPLATVRGNFQRRRVHRFAPVTTDRIRIVVTATNGDPMARIFEVRVYDEASPRLLSSRGSE